MSQYGGGLARGHLSEEEMVQLGRAGVIVAISFSHRLSSHRKTKIF
jgi:hypothetical protein